ncbi:MAG TPA: hypothetical protein VLH12_08610 [Usitatibacter sp.]|nr:hypothetical protein [Usitatibacter sp.]
MEIARSVNSLALVTLALVVGETELGLTLNARYGVLILAGAITALFFSMAWRTAGNAMTTNGEQESITADTPIGRFRILGGSERSLLIFAMAAMGYFGYVHLVAIEAQLAKMIEAQAEYNYIISLSPEARERLDIAMPESLRHKLKATRDQ